MKHARGFTVAAAVLVATLFVLLVRRHWFLGDDGFIIFRYAKNFVEGHGLVYNPGERVEGYTEPLWLLLIALGMSLGIGPEAFAPALGTVFGAGVLWVVVLFGRRLHGASDRWIWLAPLALAANRTFTAWCTSGLGAQLFAFLVVLASYLFVRETEGSRPPRALGSGLVFALATLARPEGALFFGLAGLFVLFDVVGRRRVPFRDGVRWTLPFVVLVGAHLLWRHAYYGFWLPNTFYVKVNGFWWEQARKYFGFFLTDHALPLALPFAVLALLRAPGRTEALFSVQIASWCAYLAYIGGDRFEYRFFTPILPQLFWLIAEGCRRLGDELGQWRPRARWAALPAAGLLLFCASLPEFRPPPLQPRENIAPIEAVAGYAEGRAQQGRFLRSLVEKGYLDGDELLAVRGAGALPYYSEFPILDIHGLNDVFIAHRPVEERGMIAHEKVPTLEYLQDRGVVMCNVHNTLVFKEFPEHLVHPGVKYADWFPAPVHVVEAEGLYIAFGTTLDEASFLREFRKFRILR